MRLAVKTGAKEMGSGVKGMFWGGRLVLCKSCPMAAKPLPFVFKYMAKLLVNSVPCGVDRKMTSGCNSEILSAREVLAAWIAAAALRERVWMGNSVGS